MKSDIFQNLKVTSLYSVVSAELPPIKGFLSLLNADPSTFAEIKIKDKNVHTTKTKIIHTNRNPNYDFSVVLLVKERIQRNGYTYECIYLMHALGKYATVLSILDSLKYAF